MAVSRAAQHREQKVQFTKSIFIAAAILAAPAAAWAGDPTAAPAEAGTAQPDAGAPAGLFGAMGFPSTVHMDNHGVADPNRVESVPVTFQLTNLTDQTITLKSPNDCQSHTWTVTDASGVVVDGQSVCPQVMQPVSLDVPAGKPVDKELTINMHVFKYNEGQTYTLTFNYFGLTQEAKFDVQFYLGADTAGK
jgi:hypothetical protein